MDSLTQNDLIIDAHHHLWDLQTCHYPWLMAKGVQRFFGDPTPIQKNYLLENFFTDIENLPIAGSVHIQVGVEENQALDETRWLQSVADSKKSKGFPQAIVAFCDLSTDAALAELKKHKTHANLRGIRQIIGRSPEEDLRTNSRHLLDDATWTKNLCKLAEYELSFDLQLIPEYITSAYKVLRNVPDTKIALCHCGSPFNQSKEALGFWKKELKKLAQLPNVFCKISGFGMFDHNCSTQSIRPIIETVIETFTPRRCMFGSNFPVDKLYIGYQALWQAYFNITRSLSHDEKHALFFATANEFYSLDL